MLKVIITALIISTLYSFNSLAYTPSEGNITSYFGPYLYQTNFAGSFSDAVSPALGGVGLVVNGDINEKSSLEIAIFQMNKIYFREESSKQIAQQTALAHFTFGYRRWFNEIFSTSLTFASGYSMGTPKILHSDFATGSEIATSATDTVEYGFDLSVQAELYSFEKYSVVLDTRYFKSLTAKSNENADHYGALIGLRFPVQEKSKHIK